MIHGLCRKERITIQEREREEQRQKEMEAEAKKLAEERRRQTLRVDSSFNTTYFIWKGVWVQVSLQLNINVKPLHQIIQITKDDISFNVHLLNINMYH